MMSNVHGLTLRPTFPELIVDLFAVSFFRRGSPFKLLADAFKYPRSPKMAPRNPKILMHGRSENGCQNEGPCIRILMDFAVMLAL